MYIVHLYMVYRKWISIRLVHLDVEDCSEEFLRQQSFAIKNQLVTSKAPPPCVPRPLVGGFECDELVLYGIIVFYFIFWSSIVDNFVHT